MNTLTSHAKTSVTSVLVLTGLVLVALSGSLVAGFSLVAHKLPLGSDIRGGEFGGFLTLLAVELVYLGFAAWLARAATNRSALVRYALLLQLQALMQLVSLALVVALVGYGLYLFIGYTGHPGEQQEMLDKIVGMDLWMAGYAVLLSMPALSMLAGAWRLHALSNVPGAIKAAAEGSLTQRDMTVAVDGKELRHTVMPLLERLTSRAMPGLGRPLYPSHPRLHVQDAEGNIQYELVWPTCAVKLVISLHPGEDGGQRIQVRCILRKGLHRFELIPSPLDTLAQMQYIETQFLAPLRDGLAKAAAERQRDALRERAVETQLRILQAQVEPHFLFNTLANVRQLYRGSVDAGEDMLDHLIAYLRSTMIELRAEDSTVVREMDQAMHYLAIMKIRMGERLSYRFIVPDDLLAHPFPPAMLISLVENAIKHGIASSEQGEIVLSASSADGQLRLRVLDNGAGLSSVGGTGVGLSNIRQRLEAMFGNAAWLEVGAEPGAGFTATIVIPYQERKD